MNEPPNATAILDQMFVSYDKRLRPMYGVEPVQLYLSMGFLSISHIVEENMVVRSIIYFFNVDLRIPYETKPGFIVSTNELEIVKTHFLAKRLKTKLGRQRYRAFVNILVRTRHPEVQGSNPTFASQLADTQYCRSELESEVTLVYSPLVAFYHLGFLNC